MALLFAEGCDRFSTSAGLLNRFHRVEEANVVMNTTGGPFGTGCIESNAEMGQGQAGTFTVGFPKVDSPNDLYCSFWFSMETNDALSLIGFQSTGANLSAGCYLNTTFAGGLAYTSAAASTTSREEGGSGQIIPNRWNHVQCRYRPTNGTGQFQVWLNGTQIWNDVADMVGSNMNADVAAIKFGGGNGVSSTVSFDDILIWDTTGADGFTGNVGPKRIYTLSPDGNGTTNNGTATGAASNWQAVDETGDPDTGTYVELSTTTNLELYTCANLPETPDSIDGVEVIAQARSAGATPRQGRCLARENVTTGNGTTLDVSFGSDAEYYPMRHFFNNNPDTATAWTGTTVNAMEIGYELVT